MFGLQASMTENVQDAFLRYHKRKSVDNRNRLILRMRPVIEKIAANCQKKHPNEDFAELFSDGVQGVLDALDRYKPGSALFVTFAYWRIRGEILSGIKDRSLCGLTGASQRTFDRMETEREELRETTCPQNGKAFKSADARLDAKTMIDRIESPRDRFLLQQAFLSKKTPSEIAKLCGLHHVTVSKLTHLAIKRLSQEEHDALRTSR